MVLRQNLDTKRRGTQDESYTQKPRRPLGRTWRDGKNYRAGQPTILLARNERNHQAIRQELRHLPTEQGGPTRTIWNASTQRGSRPTMEIDLHGLHYGPSNFGWIRHSPCGHRSSDQNESFHTLPEEPRRPAVCDVIPQRNRTITRHTTRHHYR